MSQRTFVRIAGDIFAVIAVLLGRAVWDATFTRCGIVGDMGGGGVPLGHASAS